MITIIILATVALVIVGATIVSATRDGYRRTPARMWNSNLESSTRRAVTQSTTASRLA